MWMTTVEVKRWIHDIENEKYIVEYEEQKETN